MQLTLYHDGSQERQIVKDELENLAIDHRVVPFSSKEHGYPTLILEDGFWIFSTEGAILTLRELAEIYKS